MLKRGQLKVRAFSAKPSLESLYHVAPTSPWLRAARDRGGVLGQCLKTADKRVCRSHWRWMIGTA